MALAFMHNRRPGGAVVVLSGAHIHRYKHIEKIPPACAEQGYTIRSCKCGDSYKTDYTDALVHAWGEWKSDEKGHWHICDRCGEVSEVVAHTPGAEATEDTPQTCTVCGYILTSAHIYTNEVISPTCTEKGYTIHTCTDCGYSYVDSETEPLGHEMASTVIKAATCVTTGERFWWCTRNCGHHYYSTFTGSHILHRISAVPATCTTNGSTEVVKCLYCGKILNAPKTIPALGHDWVGYPMHCSRCNILINQAGIG